MEFQKNMIVLEHSKVLDLKIQDRKVTLISGVKRHIHIVGIEQKIEEHQWKECLVGPTPNKDNDHPTLSTYIH